MHYNTKLEDCDATIVVSVPSDEKLRERRDSAMQFYKHIPAWAENWPSNARSRASDKSVQLASDTTIVRIPTVTTEGG